MREEYIFTFDNVFVNYIELFKSDKFLLALKNTTIISIAATLFTIVISSFAAYAFSKWVQLLPFLFLCSSFFGLCV